MMLHYCGMMLVIITYEYAHASDFSQRRETNPASRHQLASDKRSIKEPMNASKIGHLKFFVEIRPKESNDVQELFMHKVRRRRDLSTIIDDILHSDHYHHMYPPNLDFLTQLKHSADSWTLTSLIGSMGYSSVLKLMENLTPTDAHKLNSAIIKQMQHESHGVHEHGV